MLNICIVESLKPANQFKSLGTGVQLYSFPCLYPQIAQPQARSNSPLCQLASGEHTHCWDSHHACSCAKKAALDHTLTAVRHVCAAATPVSQ